MIAPNRILIPVIILGTIAGIVVAVLTQDFDPQPRPPVAVTRPDPPPVVTSQASARPPEATFDPRFRSCAHCHQIGPGARNMAGPQLTGLLGRKAGSTDYPFSKAMRESGIVWDETSLRAFLKSTQSVVPGTRMAFGGLDDKAIDALIEFLKTNP